MRKCGYCDICLQQKSAQLTNNEFTSITVKILDVLKGPTEIKQLLDQLKGIKKEKVWKVLDYMQNEQKVKVNDKGLIELVGKKL
jgi:ATP-dependent DNA helicase RecQ